MVIQARAGLVRARSELVNTARSSAKSYGELVSTTGPQNNEQQNRDHPHRFLSNRISRRGSLARPKNARLREVQISGKSLRLIPSVHLLVMLVFGCYGDAHPRVNTALVSRYYFVLEWERGIATGWNEDVLHRAWSNFRAGWLPASH
jgi:hypothetical protein